MRSECADVRFVCANLPPTRHAAPAAEEPAALSVEEATTEAAVADGATAVPSTVDSVSSDEGAVTVPESDDAAPEPAVEDDNAAPATDAVGESGRGAELVS